MNLSEQISKKKVATISSETQKFNQRITLIQVFVPPDELTFIISDFKPQFGASVIQNLMISDPELAPINAAMTNLSSKEEIDKFKQELEVCYLFEGLSKEKAKEAATNLVESNLIRVSKENLRFWK